MGYYGYGSSQHATVWNSIDEHIMIVQIYANICELQKKSCPCLKDCHGSHVVNCCFTTNSTEMLGGAGRLWSTSQNSCRNPTATRSCIGFGLYCLYRLYHHHIFGTVLRWGQRWVNKTDQWLKMLPRKSRPWIKLRTQTAILGSMKCNLERPWRMLTLKIFTTVSWNIFQNEHCTRLD